MPKVFALLTFRNEMRYLPGYFANVPPQVDGIIAVDDGSTDGSTEFVASQSSLVEFIRREPQEPHVWDESITRRLHHEACGRRGAEWLIAVDADERLERGFRSRVQEAIVRADAEHIPGLAVNFREMWDSPLHYRSDGIWGAKKFARLFRYREDAELDPRALHGHWAPLNSKTGGGYPPADLNIYHLRMIEAADRAERRRRYETLDPERRYQGIGYAYLDDPAGLELTRIPEGREYEPAESIQAR